MSNIIKPKKTMIKSSILTASVSFTLLFNHSTFAATEDNLIDQIPGGKTLRQLFQSLPPVKLVGEPGKSGLIYGGAGESAIIAGAGGSGPLWGGAGGSGPIPGKGGKGLISDGPDGKGCVIL
jgi:hypothetical protein